MTNGLDERGFLVRGHEKAPPVGKSGRNEFVGIPHGQFAYVHARQLRAPPTG
ncbi:hypothetical protein MINT15_03190 [Saccharomonospora viridis]|uniref:Uncharacterized protein n=1 Tax=Saccharomonospora viridis TaxID=1852 RepID=A0A837DG91_9PSEU|nr:hypothetical protein MINT15_03190 [Saccharomonospora viridis]